MSILAKNNLFRGKFLSKCEFEDLAAWRPPFWTEESVRRSPVVSQQSPTVEQLGDTGSPAVQPEEGASHSRPVTPDIESDRDEADENEEEEENSSDDSGGSNDESSSSDDSDSESDEQPPPPPTTTKTKTTEAPPAQVESSDKDVTGGKRADPQQQPDTTNDEAEGLKILHE